MLLKLKHSLLILLLQCAINSGNINTSGFGYELTMSRLDTVNVNLQREHLRSKQYFQTLRSEIEDLQRTVSNTETLVTHQVGRVVDLELQLKKLTQLIESVDEIPRIRSELQMISLNVSRLLADSSKIQRVQQTLPTTEMLNDFILQLVANPLNVTGTALLESRNLPRTCADVSDRRSGVHRLHPQPDFKSSFEVYCDQDYEDGGWMVIQNRYDGSVHFYRGWNDYENGFGELLGEFWIGLKRIHELTYSKPHELHIVMEDFEGNSAVAKYSHILVAGPEEKYELKSLGSYSGTAGDSLAYAVKLKFSTLDSDNDTNSGENCAVRYQGGWWYGSCHDSNLNGLYMKGKVDVFATMMCWKAFKGYNYGLKRSRMMIRVKK
ncbi:microfibril-associated glycoprotein 4-like [Toxorhynchites rutilus septentrionalis]|uniref:microfibril-associated glycoprotein 4-like n=1 Tax=Toxorhynchites rutilus septentrionalis TaxID=329112 RepID=UPI00247A15E3|nr:microfibril-associated glycoprotein 4-like [Toxorhynchites rutilus septentrionalis]